jgi:hypothetical protein
LNEYPLAPALIRRLAATSPAAIVIVDPRAECPARTPA